MKAIKQYSRKELKIIKTNRKVNPFRSGMPTKHPLIYGENYFNSFFKKLAILNINELIDMENRDEKDYFRFC